jgi:hypothetical protein
MTQIERIITDKFLELLIKNPFKSVQSVSSVF